MVPDRLIDGSPASEPIRVLHVDDDPELGETVAAMLEGVSERITVETETEPTDALDRLGDGGIDCVVSDYQMPGMDGLAFLECVRDDYPDLPFVLYTGHGSERVASDALSMGATDYLQKGRGTDQYELLANRIANAVESYRVQQRASDLERVQRLIRDINRTLVRASSREAIESSVCEAISDAEPYRFTWFGRHDAADQRIEPTAWSGVPEEYFDRVTVTTDDQPTGQGPGGRAVRTGEFAATQHVEDDPAFEPWREAVEEYDVTAVCAVPLIYEETLYGVLVLGSGKAYAFDDRERDLLIELGDDIAHAIDRLDARRALERERDRRGALFENAPDPIIEVSFGDENSYIERVNRAFEETFGFDASAVTGERIADATVPAEELPDHYDLRQRAVDGSAVEAIVNRETATGVREFRLRVIPIDVRNVSDGAYVWYSDVSERREDRRELRAVRRRFEAVFNNPIAFIGLLDTDGTVVEINETALEFVDAEADAILGASFPDTPWWNHSEALQADLRSWIVAAADGDLVRFETDHYAPDGERATIDGVLHPVRDESGAVVSILAAGRDISDRKRHEQALERQNEHLEDLASVLSHDLRNPLDVASGQLELARAECDSDHLDAADGALDRIAEIIDDTLTMAHAGRTVENTEVVSLSEVARDCWTTVSTEAATVRVASDRTLEADPTRLRHVFENLYRNSVEHGSTTDDSQTDDEQGVTVTVGTTEDGFYVADDGPGVPPEHRDSVFEAGFSTEPQGTGLGLSIVRQMVQSHGWDVAVTEGRTGGARFEVAGVEQP